MRRSRKNNAKKERIIMIASSVFVLSALTMTGIYMKSNNEEQLDNGYTLDFTALENNVQDKFDEIAQNNPIEDITGTNEGNLIGNLTEEFDNLEDDLDYTPMEAGSPLVTIPGLTDEVQEDVPSLEETETPAKSVEKNADETQNTSENNEAAAASETSQEQEQENTESTETAGTYTEPLHFSESEGLLRPVSGEVLIPFSMDGSVYFSTLNQYKYNSAMMIAADEGTAVAACAEGRVIDIFENEEIGQAVTMELGDGYRITYGQLKNINVSMNSYVSEGENIGTVASPTKYYVVEGSNLYLKLTVDGIPINPEMLFR